MSDRDRLIEIMARTAFPFAFDRHRFNAMSDVTTQAEDFERGQEDARRRIDAALAVA